MCSDLLRRSRFAAGLTLVALISTGCAAGQGSTSAPLATAPPATSSAASSVASSAADSAAARQVVADFYAAAARGDAASAVALLSSGAGPEQSTAADLAVWVGDVVALDHVVVGVPRAAAADVAQQYPGEQLLLLPVTYRATFRTGSANDTNGPAERYVLVGRPASTDAWKILAIATSP